MTDQVFKGWLKTQFEAGMRLAQESDLFELVPLGASPPDRYIAHYACKGLVRSGDGAISETNSFLLGLWFPEDYLRSRDPHLPYRVLTWLGPPDIWHPNISNEHPVICAGRLLPGTGLVQILYQVYEIISWNKITMVESDALNTEACAWARRHKHLFPVDRRPLKRQRFNLTLKSHRKEMPK